MKPLVIYILAVLAALVTVDGSAAEQSRCQPTRPDADGPFYRAGAPLRNSVGTGYLLSGSVKSAADCSTLAAARIEIWLNGPDGRYGDQWRATLHSSSAGTYQFESHIPVSYGSRPPHIHIIVNAEGFRELITQHYPKEKAKSATFDLVLIPNK